MTEYHVGCSPLTNRIFAGKVRVDKDGNRVWSGERTDVTMQCQEAIVQFLLNQKPAEDGMVNVFGCAGKHYVLMLGEVVEDGKEKSIRGLEVVKPGEVVKYFGKEAKE